MAVKSTYENALEDVGKVRKRGNIFRFSKTYPAWLILIIASGLSYFLMQYLENQLQDTITDSFDEATSSVITRINSKFDTKLQIMQSVDAVFDKSYVVRDVFEINTSNPVETYPSIRTFGKAFKVEKGYLDEFIYNTRSQGYYDMKVKLGKETPYYIYEYMFPYESNMDRHGFDIGQDTITRRIMIESARLNKILMTPIHEIREGSLGFFLVSPLYMFGMPSDTPEERNENYESSLLMEIDANEFFKNAIGNGIATDSTIAFKVLDHHYQENTKVFESFNSELFDESYNADRSKVETLVVAGHEVDVEFQTVPEFVTFFQRNLPMIALSGGILLSLFLFGFVISVITSRQRAEELAERMTRSQRRIVESSQDIIAVLDFQGVWKSMNPACEKIFKKTAEELIGEKIDDLFFSKEDSKIFYDLVASNKDEHTERVDVRMQNRSQEMRWLNWSFTISKSDNLIYAIGRDVTLEKEAEEQQLIASKQVHLAERFSREASESKSIFMTKLSHQLRNSLTGILGYMQLVEQGIYDTTEEMNSYIKLAEESSEEIYQFVTDIIDMTAETDKNQNVQFEKVDFYEAYENAAFKLHFIPELPDCILNLDESAKGLKFYGDKKIMSELLLLCFANLAVGTNRSTLKINATANDYENALEIQIEGPENTNFEKMLKFFKENKDDVLEAIEEDEDDFVMNLALIESNTRRLNGSVVTESFGGEDGNIIMITVPLNLPKF